jgi:thioredoxin-like negative regulator of GroEL
MSQQSPTNEEVKKTMFPLSQDHLELLLQMPNPPSLVVIYFTAKWCGPCNALNLNRILSYRPGIQWMLCDVDDNDYSLGFCQGRSIPAWLAIVKGKPLPLFQSSNEATIFKWLSELPKI